MKMTKQEIQYILNEVDNEIEWYEKCINLVANDIQISGTNKRAGTVLNAIRNSYSDALKVKSNMELLLRGK